MAFILSGQRLMGPSRSRFYRFALAISGEGNWQGHSGCEGPAWDMRISRQARRPRRISPRARDSAAATPPQQQLARFWPTSAGVGTSSAPKVSESLRTR